MKARRWSGKFRNCSVIYGPYYYETPITERRFRALMRDLLNTTRLIGFECWPSGAITA